MLVRFWILLLASVFLTGSLTGCASILPRHGEEPKDSLAYDVQEAQQEDESVEENGNSGRAGRLFGKKRTSDCTEMNETGETQETKTEPEKKKRAPKGFLYGGLSSEAREIEDSLYGR